MDTSKLQVTSELTKSQIIELVQHAQTDEQVNQWTSDPTRFKDESAVSTWLKNIASILVLTNESGTLLGIVWFQSSPFPDVTNSSLSPEEALLYTTTSAIRLYGAARGKGLSVWFYHEALQRYGDRPIWDRVSADNLPSMRLHEKLGFRQVTQPDQQNKVILVSQSANNRLQ